MLSPPPRRGFIQYMKDFFTRNPPPQPQDKIIPAELKYEGNESVASTFALALTRTNPKLVEENGAIILDDKFRLYTADSYGGWNRGTWNYAISSFRKAVGVRGSADHFSSIGLLPDPKTKKLLEGDDLLKRMKANLFACGEAPALTVISDNQIIVTAAQELNYNVIDVESSRLPKALTELNKVLDDGGAPQLNPRALKQYTPNA